MKPNWPAQLAFQLQALGLPLPEAEYVFAPPRKFRADLAYVELRLAIEIDGIVYTRGSHQAGGRHTSIKGLRAESEKSFFYARHGWKVLRVLPEHVRSGQALKWIEQLVPKAAEEKAS